MGQTKRMIKNDPKPWNILEPSTEKLSAVTASNASILQSSGLPPLGKHCPGRWLQRPEAKQWSSLVYISAPPLPQNIKVNFKALFTVKFLRLSQVAEKPFVFDSECL